jgi:hypothetical protein
MRSMLVGGARMLWWDIWFLLIFAGAIGGCVWMSFHPVVVTGPEAGEIRGVVTVAEYVFWCLTFTFSLLWIYTVVVLFRFGLWPRAPERTRGFPVIMK